MKELEWTFEQNGVEAVGLYFIYSISLEAANYLQFKTVYRVTGEITNDYRAKSLGEAKRESSMHDYSYQSVEYSKWKKTLNGLIKETNLGFYTIEPEKTPDGKLTGRYVWQVRSDKHAAIGYADDDLSAMSGASEDFITKLTSRHGLGY